MNEGEDWDDDTEVELLCAECDGVIDWDLPEGPLTCPHCGRAGDITVIKAVA